MQVQQPDIWRQSRNVASSLYRAAISPDPLTNWSRIFSSLADNLFVDFTLMGPTGKVTQIGTMDPDGLENQDFLARYQFINPLNRYWQRAPQGQLIHFDQQLIDDTCRRSEFYVRYREFLDARDGVCMLLGEGRSQKVLVHMRLPQQQSAAERSMQLLANLGDDLVTSFEIAGAFLNAAHTLKCVVDSLDHEGVGMAILSEDGRIENANRSMNAMMQSGDVVRMERGRIAHGSSGAAPHLSDLIRRTAHGGVHGRLRYSEPGSRRHGNIMAYPARSVVDWNVANQDKIILLVKDSSQKHREMKEKLRSNFGLTITEARVAERLHEGKTSREIATEFSVQPNCVRTHLKSIYAKTGTHSQVELVSFLQRGTEDGFADCQKSAGEAHC